MGTDEENMEALLRMRARAGRADEEGIAALRADAPWPAGLGRRLMAEARAAIAGIGAAKAPSVVLRIRALGERIEAFFGGGELVEAALVRGDAPGGVLVRHAFGVGTASTHVDLAGDRFVVMVDLGADAPARGTRVVLARDGRELASESLRKGRWLLPTLPAGAYRLRATDRSGAVAELDLVLERSAD